MGDDYIPLGGAPSGQGPHPSVGINAKRSCTDCICLIVFFICCGVMGWVAQLAIINGNPERLIKGTDYMGNICGRGSPNVTVHDWSERKLLWYPITYSPKRREILVKEAMSLGICVKSCPSRETIGVEGYGSADPDKPWLPSPEWPVLFNSDAKFHRCIPDFLTFDCNSANECLDSLSQVNNSFISGSDIVSTGSQAFEEVETNWWVILLSVGIAILVSFFWLFALRRLVKPAVVLICFLVLAALGVGGYLCRLQRDFMRDLEPPEDESAKLWNGGMIACWVACGIFLCILIFLRKDLMIACDVIEEASKVPLSIPTMTLVAPIILLLVLPFVVFYAIVALYIQTSGDTITVSVMVPQYNESVVDFSNTSSIINSGANLDTSMSAKEYELQNWRLYAHLYNLFFFLWCFGLLNAIAFEILALCANFWYWSKPGDAKTPPAGSVLIALKITLRYHLGTLALGSCIVAIIQVVRVIVLVIEHRLQKIGENSDATKFLFKVLHCCLACLERVVKFINKNAYILTALTGTSFIEGARMALDLLAGNALSVGAVTVISEYVTIFGKIVITASSTAIAWVIMNYADVTDGVTSGVIVLAIVAIISYFVACLFMSILDVCIDTILICYCYDKCHSEIDYFPSDLAKHVDRASVKRSTGETHRGNGLQQELLSPPELHRGQQQHHSQSRESKPYANFDDL